MFLIFKIIFVRKVRRLNGSACTQTTSFLETVFYFPRKSTVLRYSVSEQKQRTENRNVTRVYERHAGKRYLHFIWNFSLLSENGLFSFWYKLLYNLEKYEYFIWNIENNWNVETGEQREREKKLIVKIIK